METTRQDIRDKLAYSTDKVQEIGHLNEKGAEVLDSTPIAKPIGWKEPESIAQQIQRMVREELSLRAQVHGAETFEEADDFDTGGDPDLRRSAYEIDEDLPAWKEDEVRAEIIREAEERFAASKAELDRLKAAAASTAASPPPQKP